MKHSAIKEYGRVGNFMAIASLLVTKGTLLSMEYNFVWLQIWPGCLRGERIVATARNQTMIP
jgi:hypothetical protein